jgi:hypothetical protein
MIKLKELFKVVVEATRQEIQNNYGGPVSDHANISIKLRGVNTKTKRIEFTCVDANGNHRPQIVRIAMDEHKYLSRDRDLQDKDKIELALTEGQLRYTCTCPSFKYGGFEYISNIHKSSLTKQPRRPVIRNPREEGLTCKHINAVAEQIENFIEPIANEFAGSRTSHTYGHREIRPNP